MHDASLRLMDGCLERLAHLALLHGDDGVIPLRLSVLDIASYDINGAYRPLVEGRGWAYTGLDIREGPNVDIVSANPARYPVKAATYDAVICGNALHHMAMFWTVIPEMARVLKPGGLLAVVASTWSKPESTTYPAGDYYRFMPDALRFLFDETGVLVEYAIATDGMDVVGSAFKNG